MKFGTFLLLPSPKGWPTQELYARGVEFAQKAEAHGFDSIWIAEHHFSTYACLPRPLMMATHLAAKTSTIRVGTAVVVLPLHNPLVVAEEIALADVLSNGRLDVGLGRGYQQYEFERFGMSLDESRPRWEEAVDILIKAFTEETFSYQGKYYSFPELSILPKPVQKPFPPILVTAQSPESIVAAVRRGFGILTGGAAFPIERVAEFRKLFLDAVAASGAAITPRFSVQQKVYVSHNEEDAREMASQALWNMRVSLNLRLGREVVNKGIAVAVPAENEPTIEELVQKFVMFGTPDQCIQRMERLRDEVGMDHVNCDFWSGDIPRDKVLSSMELFTKEVMPHFKK